MSIVLKQVGQNLIINVDGKAYSKKFADKTERDEVILQVKTYNESPNKKDEQSIIHLFTSKEVEVKKKVAETTEKVEKLEKQKKEAKKESPKQKEEEELKEKNNKLELENKKLKAELEEAKGKPVPIATPSATRHSGEN